MLLTPGQISLTNIPRADLESNAGALFPLHPREFIVWDGTSMAGLPNPSASDDLGVYNATFGAAVPYIGTSDLKGVAGPTTRYARIICTVPPEFAGAYSAMFFRARAGMITTVADTSATLDVEAYKISGALKTGFNLVSTAAQSINSTTWDDYDFAIDSATLAAGDELDIRVTIAVADAATATAVIAAFRAFLGCTIRG